ncbi:MAG: hypothetical protein KDA28_12850 [Phycisphaerales bacterium]|nr:hypothetical protein [Phycisphaerales bacterium]
MKTICILGAVAGAAAAAPFDYASPTFDRWNYPFNQTPGVAPLASTFGPGFTPGLFDDKDGQFLTSYVTAGDVTPGAGASNYLVSSATLTVRSMSDMAFEYDPTYDSYRTHLLPNDGDWTPDTDAGRPLEVYGTAFRNGFDAFSFNEFGPWGFGDPTSEDLRNAFATDDGSRDVSNNIRDRFETTPWAIGQIAGVAPGDLVPAGTGVTFELDLGNPDVVAYLQHALNEGIVSLSVTSMATAVQGGPIVYPQIATKENFGQDASPARFSIEVEVVPAPGAGLSLLGLGAWRRRRRS